MDPTKLTLEELYAAIDRSAALLDAAMAPSQRKLLDKTRTNMSKTIRVAPMLTITGLNPLVIEQTVQQYNTPNEHLEKRHYHTFDHAVNVAQLVMQWDAAFGLTNPAEVVAAALFHDAVYDPALETNEVESADWASEHFGGYECLDWTIVRGHIEGTSDIFTHPIDNDEAVLIDCDVAQLLAGTWEECFHADRQIVQEFVDAGIDPDVVRIGRRDFLQKLQARGVIFNMPEIRCWYEEHAQTNLARLLKEIYGAEAPF